MTKDKYAELVALAAAQLLAVKMQQREGTASYNRNEDIESAVKDATYLVDKAVEVTPTFTTAMLFK